jgi:uncharacterized protein YndB with AHSA1/START domain
MTDSAPVEIIVHVPAAPADVFPYLTDPDRYVRWMGREARLEPVPGGVYRVAMADGFAAAGTFAEVAAPHRVVFSWGFADDEAAAHTRHAPGETPPGGAMPAGSTRVTVTLETVTLEDGAGGTRLTLRHENLPSDELRAAHDVAWNTYLPRLAVVAAGGDPGPDPHA